MPGEKCPNCESELTRPVDHSVEHECLACGRRWDPFAEDEEEDGDE